MKQITITNNKLQLIKAKALSFILAVLVIVMFGSSLKSSIDQMQPDYLTYVEQEVKEFKVYEGSEAYTEVICLNEKSEEVKYYVYMTAEEFGKNIAVADVIKVGYIPGNYNLTKYVSKGTTEIVNQLEDLKTTAKSTLIFSIVCIILAVAYLAWKLIEILKKPETETHEYVEYALSQENLITNKMMDKNSKTRKYMLVYNIFCAVFAGIIFGVVLFFNSILSLVGDKKVIFYIVFGVVMVTYLVLLFVFMPKFNSKQSGQYAIDYFNYIEKGPSFASFYSPYEFRDLSKRSIVLEDNEENTEEIEQPTSNKSNIVLIYNKKGQELSYDVDKLNLYVVGVYHKNFFGGNVFIATDRSDLGEKEVDFIFPLTFENYNQIKELGIEVKGLDYLKKNFAEEIVKNTLNAKNKNIVIKYNEK